MTTGEVSQLLDSPLFFFETAPLSPLATPLSPIFVLSRELRDIIYHYLWTDSLIAQCQTTSIETFEIEYERQDDDDDDEEEPYRHPTRLPTWLLTSKQVLAEGMQSFYAQAICTEYIVDHDRDALKDSKFSLLALHRFRQINPALRRAAVQIDVVISLGDGVLVNIRDSDQIEPFEGDKWLRLPDDFDQVGEWGVIVPNYDGSMDEDVDEILPPTKILDIIESAAIRKNFLKFLTLKFASPVLLDYDNEGAYKLLPEQEEGSVEWHVDLSYLEGFGDDLERVHFALEVPKTMREWDKRPSGVLAEIYVRLQQNLEQVAKKLVGGEKGIPWTMRDWLETYQESFHEADGYVKAKAWHREWVETYQEELGKLGTVKPRAWHLEVFRSKQGSSNDEISFLGLERFPGYPPEGVFDQEAFDEHRLAH